MNTTLQAGLSTLKTLYCYKADYQRPQLCPVCQENMQKLAKKLPSTDPMVSSLICRISGEVMDEDNPPMALPNGQVYSKKALTQMAEMNNGIVVCKVTGKEFMLSEATKIFLS